MMSFRCSDIISKIQIDIIWSHNHKIITN